MKNILNITNGDCTVDVMKKSALPGVFLPWRDLLHDGPVPENLSLEALSKTRAEFISSRGWGTVENIRREFVLRDNTLKTCSQYEKVILWFEHDLYDQLQLLQILDWFYQKGKQGANLSIICVDQYLGLLSPDEMLDLIQYEEAITDDQLQLANRAWSAYRSSTPDLWQGLLKADTTALPFLQGAIIRMLEEYPDVSNGLSRTAQQALTCIAGGEKLAGAVFAQSQAVEERKFLGDSSFWLILQELLDAKPALLELPEGEVLTLPTTSNQVLAITSAGLDVLAAKMSWLEIAGLDRWIGGVHLQPPKVWCWDSELNVMIEIMIEGDSI